MIIKDDDGGDGIEKTTPGTQPQDEENKNPVRLTNIT